MKELFAALGFTTIAMLELVAMGVVMTVLLMVALALILAYVLEGCPKCRRGAKQSGDLKALYKDAIMFQSESLDFRDHLISAFGGLVSQIALHYAFQGGRKLVTLDDMEKAFYDAVDLVQDAPVKNRAELIKWIKNKDQEFEEKVSKKNRAVTQG